MGYFVVTCIFFQLQGVLFGRIQVILSSQLTISGKLVKIGIIPNKSMENREGMKT